jgi:hypothetical protein
VTKARPQPKRADREEIGPSVGYYPDFFMLPEGSRSQPVTLI